MTTKSVRRLLKIRKSLNTKFQKTVPALLLFSLTTNLSAALSNISSTLPWAGEKNRFVESIGIKPSEEVEKELKKIEVIMTAYSSTEDQTDSTPFITAANTSTRDGIIAANFLEFHTKVQIPQLYGDKVFTVEDRMNSRYNTSNPPRMDIWLPTRSEAIVFGVKKAEIIILE